jgi:hypothetical protein
MALLTRQFSRTQASAPWRIGLAVGARIARVMHAVATWSAAAQLGPDRETEIGRSTGARI